MSTGGCSAASRVSSSASARRGRTGVTSRGSATAHMAFGGTVNARLTHRRRASGFGGRLPGKGANSGIRLNTSLRHCGRLPDKGVASRIRLITSLRLRGIPVRLAARRRHRLDHAAIPSRFGGSARSICGRRQLLRRRHAITIYITFLLRIVDNCGIVPHHVWASQIG